MPRTVEVVLDVNNRPVTPTCWKFHSQLLSTFEFANELTQAITCTEMNNHLHS